MSVLFDNIKPGDTVHYKTPQGQSGKGKVVMNRGTHLVLNAGGRYGRPQVVTDKNYIKHSRGGKVVGALLSRLSVQEGRNSDADADKVEEKRPKAKGKTVAGKDPEKGWVGQSKAYYKAVEKARKGLKEAAKMRVPRVTELPNNTPTKKKTPEQQGLIPSPATMRAKAAYKLGEPQMNAAKAFGWVKEEVRSPSDAEYTTAKKFMKTKKNADDLQLGGLGVHKKTGNIHVHLITKSGSGAGSHHVISPEGKELREATWQGAEDPYNWDPTLRKAIFTAAAKKVKKLPGSPQPSKLDTGRAYKPTYNPPPRRGTANEEAITEGNIPKVHGFENFKNMAHDWANYNDHHNGGRPLLHQKTVETDKVIHQTLSIGHHPRSGNPYVIGVFNHIGGPNSEEGHGTHHHYTQGLELDEEVVNEVSKELAKRYVIAAVKDINHSSREAEGARTAAYADYMNKKAVKRSNAIAKNTKAMRAYKDHVFGKDIYKEDSHDAEGASSRVSKSKRLRKKLHELNTSTLASYVSKAIADRKARGSAELGRLRTNRTEYYTNDNGANKKIEKRSAGIKKALAKIASHLPGEPLKAHADSETSKHGGWSGMNEVSAPGKEAWIKANKQRFIAKYGKEKGTKILYAKAWKDSKAQNEARENEWSANIQMAASSKSASKPAKGHYLMRDGRRLSGPHSPEEAVKQYKGMSDSKGVKIVHVKEGVEFDVTTTLMEAATKYKKAAEKAISLAKKAKGNKHVNTQPELNIQDKGGSGPIESNHQEEGDGKL